MLFWLLVLVGVLLLIGPTRRGILSAWRFLLPAAGGLIVGFVLGRFLVSFGLPHWVLLFMPVALALSAGAEGKAWFDKTFGPPSGHRP